MIRQLEAIAAAIVTFSRQHAVLVTFSWIAAGSLFAVLSFHLRLDGDVSSFLNREGSHWESYEELVESFGSDEFLVVAIEGPKGVASSSFEKDLARFSAALSRIPGVLSVKSAASVPIAIDRGSEKTLSFMPRSDSEGECAECFRRALSSPLARGLGLAGRQGEAIGLNVYLDVGERRPAALRRVTQLMRTMPGAAVSGVPLFRSEVVRIAGNELFLLTPLVAALVAGLVGVALSSGSVAILVVCCGLISATGVLAMLSFSGIPLSLATFPVPAITFCFAGSYVVHMIVGRPVDQPAGEKFTVPVAVLVSGVTTGIGFLAIASVPVDAIRHLGISGAVGALLATLCSMTLGVVFCRNEASSKIRGEKIGRAATCLWTFCLSHPWQVLIAWAVLGAGLGFGAVFLRLDSDITAWFGAETRVRRDFESVRNSLSGITPLSLMISSEKENALTEPEVVRAVEALVEHIDGHSDVDGVVGYTDVLRELRSGLVDEEEVLDQVAIRQLLLVGSSQVEQLLRADERSGQLVARLNTNSSERILALGRDVERWWSEQGPKGFSLASTGIMFEFARSQDAIVRGQLRGIVTAAFAIVLVLAGVFWDARIIGPLMISSLVPIVVGFGTMGWLGVDLDAATSCIGAIAFGIAVDDSVHLGLARGQAVAACPVSRRFGVLFLTTLSVCLGFAVLGLSDFAMVQRLGLFSAATIGICLLADFTLLPALFGLAGVRRTPR